MLWFSKCLFLWHVRILLYGPGLGSSRCEQNVNFFLFLSLFITLPVFLFVCIFSLLGLWMSVWYVGGVRTRQQQRCWCSEFVCFSWWHTQGWVGLLPCWLHILWPWGWGNRYTNVVTKHCLSNYYCVACYVVVGRHSMPLNYGSLTGSMMHGDDFKAIWVNTFHTHILPFTLKNLICMKHTSSTSLAYKYDEQFGKCGLSLHVWLPTRVKCLFWRVSYHLEYLCLGIIVSMWCIYI